MPPPLHSLFLRIGWSLSNKPTTVTNLINYLEVSKLQLVSYLLITLFIFIFSLIFYALNNYLVVLINCQSLLICSYSYLSFYSSWKLHFWASTKNVYLSTDKYRRSY